MEKQIDMRDTYNNYEEIQQDYDRFDEHNVFTKYIMDKITIEQRREIRKDWNKEGHREMRWQNYLIKRVNKYKQIEMNKEEIKHQEIIEWLENHPELDGYNEDGTPTDETYQDAIKEIKAERGITNKNK